MRPYAPLATLYAAAVPAQRRLHSVALFDAMLADGEHEFVAALGRHRPRWVALYEDNFNFLTKMCLSRMREAACAMAEAASAAGATVIAAGPDVTDHPELYFPHGVQFALLGEPDHTLRELLDALSGRVPRAGRRDRRARRCPIPARRRTCAAPPSARPSGIPTSSRSRPGTCSTSSATARPGRAPTATTASTWSARAAAPSTATGARSRSGASATPCARPANVAEELALVKRALRPDHIWFADDIFGLRPQWVAEFGREVAARDAAVPFMIQSRVDLMTERGGGGPRRRPGCAEVWMGAESGSQKILDAMEKGTEVAADRRRPRAAAGGRHQGLLLHPVRLPRRDVRGHHGHRAAGAARPCPTTSASASATRCPGTRFHEMVERQLGDKTNWVDSDDLAMMFQGTYDSPFYRHLHRLLHHDLLLRAGCSWQPRARRAVRPRTSSDDLDRAERRLARAGPAGRRPSATRADPRRRCRCSSSPAPDLSKEWN